MVTRSPLFGGIEKIKKQIFSELNSDLKMTKKLLFKFYRYILSRSYPFKHWLKLLYVYSKLWLHSFFCLSIVCLLSETSLIWGLKFYFVINFFLMIIIVLYSYGLTGLLRLVYDTINEIFRITFGRLFGFETKRYENEQIPPRGYFGKNILDFEGEKSKIFEKKYEEIDFLVLNYYIGIEEGDRRIDGLLKEEYRCGFYRTLGSNYSEVEE